jgi:predicted negative regulator of RcsB-dependent stress response
LVAHELTHTQQYKNYKTILGFGWDYWGEFDKNKDQGMNDSDAYKNISFEVDARNNADRIIQVVMQVYDNNQPCLNGQPNPLKAATPKGFSQEVFDCQNVLFALGYLPDKKYVDG